MAKSSKSNTTGASGPARSGGATMNKNVRVPIRTGSPTANKVSPAAAANIGVAKGDHVTEKGTVRRPPEPLVTGKMPAVPMGNAVALNVGGGGPGKRRVIHERGTQSQHGPVAGSPEPKGRDILSDFGPSSLPGGASHGKRTEAEAAAEINRRKHLAASTVVKLAATATAEAQAMSDQNLAKHTNVAKLAQLIAAPLSNAQIGDLLNALAAIVRGRTEDAFLRDIVRDNRVPPSAQPPAEKVTVGGAISVAQVGNGKGWSEATPLPDRPPHSRGVDALLDAEDARWRAERKRQFGG